MNTLTLDTNGYLTLHQENQTFISSSPVGTLIVGGTAHLPKSGMQDGNTIILHYTCGDCVLSVEQKERYYKLTVLSVPEEAGGFVFGPYQTDASTFGEVLGAAWYDNGCVACIQSLMPKVVGGCKVESLKNKNNVPLHEDPAAEIDKTVYLQCSVSNRTKESAMDYLDMKNVMVKATPLPDGEISGASIALIAADSADDLISIISDMELAEGLPHPYYQGSYVKTDRRATSYYMIFGGSGLTNEERIEYAGRAGVSCIYFSDLLDSWGHFHIDSNNFPNGVEQVAALSDMAARYKVDVGTHTLSNFIHTYDPYVTPVPHDNLLIMDQTELTCDACANAVELHIKEDKNYATSSTLNTLRIGDELITYSEYDAKRKCLIGCTRGTFDTKAAAHQTGDTVSRLWDHGYRTLFPDINLQREMADRLGKIIRDGKLHRMSFDGLEGCAYTGGGEYAMANYVQRVLDIVGNDIVCEGSRITHYLWHAFAYCNWGEPWYDDARRGGMQTYRTHYLPFFKRNLIPNMLGWFAIWLNRGKYEATPPENVEFILSRSTAFDAGMALFSESEVAKKHGKYGEYLDLVRLWGDFRLHANIPDNVKEKMQEETSNWHLEKTEDGWVLSELIIRNQDLDYTDRVVKAEAGYVDNNVKESKVEGRRNHSSHMVCDFSYEGIEETTNFRIRVGKPGHGYLENLEFPTLKFHVIAEGGDYLIYKGGMELYHCDANYNIKEVIKGEGKPLTWKDLWFSTLQYTTDLDDDACYMFTEIRTRRVYHIQPRK